MNMKNHTTISQLRIEIQNSRKAYSQLSSDERNSELGKKLLLTIRQQEREYKETGLLLRVKD